MPLTDKASSYPQTSLTLYISTTSRPLPILLPQGMLKKSLVESVVQCYLYGQPAQGIDIFLTVCYSYRQYSSWCHGSVTISHTTLPVDTGMSRGWGRVAKGVGMGERWLPGEAGNQGKRVAK